MGEAKKKIEILFPENYRKVSKILAILVPFKAFWSKIFSVQVWWIKKVSAKQMARKKIIIKV